MRMLARWFALIALMLAPSAWAANGSYSGLYVFGDSLVDSGNAYIGTLGAEPSPANGYFAGRFSNGFNFADYLSFMISGKPTTALLAGGLNAAVGGATAAYDPAETSPSFLSQIGYYDKLNGKPIDPNALVLVTFGGNDVRDTIGTGGAVDFSASVQALAYGLSELYQQGARNLLIVGSPDIGLLPASALLAGGVPGRLAELTARSQALNTQLAALAGLANTVPGVTAGYFDLFGYEHDLLANPAAYGLPSTLNTTTPCQIPGAGSPQLVNCSNALYFDAIHPTTQVHKAIATAIAGQLGIRAVPETQIWVMLILGVGMAGASLRRRRAHAVPA
ncbi:SGNH/GDSL hydrolase family protein [uncultured Sphingomonas sp.]|uniref:SGNH/GDSL hydrolase family protein n=1 Tax=uncultured Sphingomonas sp. TaxID=158754 RepID=UPI0025ECB88D|nr:SGNH/GDSL hydrolase family protein [uncultured Sphingomonas sp.]